MRYSAAEKREIIDLVESSSLPVRRTLDQLGIPKSTFYGWYERFREGGDEALVDCQPRSERTWNQIPNTVREAILELALEASGLESVNVKHRPRLSSDNGHLTSRPSSVTGSTSAARPTDEDGHTIQ